MSTGPETSRRSVPVLQVADFVAAPVNDNVTDGAIKHSELDRVYIPNWDNKPAPVPDVLKLGDVPVLGHQNMSAVIANPGSGKSSIMEAIAASYLNPNADCLGFQVDPSCRGIIIIDNERTNPDVWNGFSRMCRRAEIYYGQKTENVVLAGLRSIARLEERIKTIEFLIQNNPCSLLLIDGAGDLVYDTNDLAQAIDCRVWLREITVKYDTSILVTLHPNPNTTKPRGHQGSEICREAECVLLVKPHDDYSKIITSDFEHGKNRNNPKLTTAFQWSDSQMMFVSADYDDLIVGKQTARDGAKRAEAMALAKVILPPPASMRRTDFVEAVMDKTSQTKASADRKIKDMLGWGIVKKHDDGLYRLHIK